MAKAQIQNVEPVEGNRTRYTVIVPRSRVGADVVVVIMSAGDEVVTVSQEAGARASKRAVEAVYRHLHSK